ncbi:MAG TPA: hypothetical protein PKM59_13835 [Thermodesulfobacteriota bacterium]|nr:hypothetical protein [Thermodesulfobacteriota bacterium]
MKIVAKGIVKAAALTAVAVSLLAAPFDGNLLSAKALGATLWTWGNNTYGQLGDGTTVSGFSPAPVGTAADWTSVSILDVHAVALQADGSLWAWGKNNYGQLGDGTTTTAYTPIHIGTDTDWRMVSPGSRHTIALKTNGSLWAWGNNKFNQLGDNSDNDSYTPIQIGTDTDWQMVSVGLWHTLALKTDGTLWAWGYNYYGQLGTAESTYVDIPTKVFEDTDWSSVSAGHLSTLALKTNGTLWTWGYNYYGQLGNGTTASTYVPSQIGTDTNWKAVSGGYSHTVALKTDGTLWAWGYNAYGQLGDGTTNSSYVPIQIGMDTDWEWVRTGGWHTVARKTDGTVWVWGYNRFGQLGTGTMNNVLVPTQLGNEVSWEILSAGYSSTAAVAIEPTPSSAAIQILGIDSSLTVNPKDEVPVNPKPGQMFQVRMNTVSPEGVPLVYQFYYRSGYGTPEWYNAANPWHVLQEWSPNNWVNITFDTPDTYFVIGHVVPEGETWEDGPQAGFSVVVSDDSALDPVDTQIIGVSSNLLTSPQPGQNFRFAVNTAAHTETALQYRFYYRSGYGTPEWYNAANPWHVLQEWSPNNWAHVALAEPGTYYVVGHVVPEGEIWEDGDPQGGFTVTVE